MNDVLRSNIIRLASEHPEFRKDLLPLLKTASMTVSGLKALQVRVSEANAAAKAEAERLVKQTESEGRAAYAQANASMWQSIKDAFQSATGLGWVGDSRMTTLRSTDRGVVIEVSLHQLGTAKLAWGSGYWGGGNHALRQHEVTIKWESPDELASKLLSEIEKAGVNPDLKDVSTPRPDMLLKLFQGAVRKYFGDITMADIPRMMFKYVGGQTDSLNIVMDGKKAIIRSDRFDSRYATVGDLVDFIASKGAQKARF